MRIFFAGTPEIALPSLRILNASYDVCGVLTNPDRPAGRKRILKASPVKILAQELDIPVYNPEKLDASFRAIVSELKPDLLVVVAYGKIFGPKFLDVFAKGGINLHPSLLPRYRGPSPLSEAILAGDSNMGITVQKLAIKLDSGDIIVQESYPLTGMETTESLTLFAGKEGSKLVVRAVDALVEDETLGVAQNEEDATYCKKVKKEDGFIDWNSSVETIEQMVRGYLPWPVACTMFGEKKLFILESALYKGEKSQFNEKHEPGKVLGVDKEGEILIKTKDAVLVVRRLQIQGKKPLYCKDFLNGVQDFIGTVLRRCE